MIVSVNGNISIHLNSQNKNKNNAVTVGSGLLGPLRGFLCRAKPSRAKKATSYAGG